MWNKCPGCSATTQARDEFCPYCGRSLLIKCSRCGATWRYYYHYKFCRSCGTKVGGK